MAQEQKEKTKPTCDKSKSAKLKKIESLERLSTQLSLAVLSNDTQLIKKIKMVIDRIKSISDK